MRGRVRVLATGSYERMRAVAAVRLRSLKAKGETIIRDYHTEPEPGHHVHHWTLPAKGTLRESGLAILLEENAC